MEYETVLKEVDTSNLHAYSKNQQKKVEWVKQLYSNFQKKLKACNNTDRHLTKTANGQISAEGCKEFLVLISPPKYCLNTIRNAIVPTLKLLFKEQQEDHTDSDYRRLENELKKGYLYCKSKVVDSPSKPKFQMFPSIMEQFITAYPPKANSIEHLAIMTIGFCSTLRACSIDALELRDIVSILPTTSSKDKGDWILTLNFRKSKGYWSDNYKNFIGYATKTDKLIVDPVYYLLEHLYVNFNFKRGNIQKNIVEKIKRQSTEIQTMKLFQYDIKEYSRLLKKAARYAGFSTERQLTFHSLRHSQAVNGTLAELEGKIKPGTSKHLLGHASSSGVHETVYLQNLSQCLNSNFEFDLVPELLEPKAFNGISTDVVPVSPIKAKREYLHQLYDCIRDYSKKSFKRKRNLYRQILFALKVNVTDKKLDDGELTDMIAMKFGEMTRDEQVRAIEDFEPIIKAYYESKKYITVFRGPRNEFEALKQGKGIVKSHQLQTMTKSEFKKHKSSLMIWPVLR